MIKLVITLLTALCFSCSADSHDGKNLSVAARPSTGPAESALNQSPNLVVTEFMKFISSAEKDKANALLTREVTAESFASNVSREANSKSASSNLSPDKLHRFEEKVPRLDWVSVLTERKYRLARIVEEKTEGEKSEVIADLGVNDQERFHERARFRLEKVDGRWLISDLELLGKPPSSNES